MDELDVFVDRIKSISSSKELDIFSARQVVKEINDFLFTTHKDIGVVFALGREYPYFSDFHKYWNKNYKKILNATICIEQCEKVADALHDIYVKSKGKAFYEIYDTCGLSKEQICRVRFLTANQDFKGSRNFSDLAKKYKNDPSVFDVKLISESPHYFISNIGMTKLSQGDKRENYAKNISDFIIEKNLTSPYDLLKFYDNDVLAFKKAVLDCHGSGYGNKKIDMFIRDMVVLKVWENVKNFDSINVASDINTIKIALRTGILQTSIPLVSSFLDYFGEQYGYIDDMSAEAWRYVWQSWKSKYPNETIASPCLLDYLIYKVIGKSICKEKLLEFKCDKYDHVFYWHSPQNRTCQECYKKGLKNKAHIVKKMLPCDSIYGDVYIKQTDFYMANICEPNISNCPFMDICNNYSKKYLMPPKSISIEGQTGWNTAYTDKDSGGGGLMS